MRVLVTGGHVRLGGAISEELARGGHSVLINYRSNRGAAEELAERLSGEHGVECAIGGADLTSLAEGMGLMARALEWGADAMVASASIHEADRAGAIDQGVWDRSHAIHYSVPARMMLELRRRVERCSGLIISDQAMLNGSDAGADFFSYSMSKSAMLSALPRLAISMAPGRLNALAPGFTLPTINAEGEDFEGERDKTILRRGSRVGDVARAARYLLEAEGVTGQAMAVDGGLRLSGVVLDPARFGWGEGG